ncbi:TPA: hypothetical protein ACIJO6_002300 [Klebsiella aerogenes]|uniref:hypothetical protein n=2 Tax=Klebsiella aerogenes TaxID=548 RepID=UPI000A5FB160|nr:hypothetical protein [Klebsiella aerogenes]
MQSSLEGRSGHGCSIQGGPLFGMDGKVGKPTENIQTFTVKLEIDATDAQKAIDEINKKIGAFMACVEVADPVFRVAYFRKTGGHVLGFQAEEEIKPSGGFFHSKATPDLKGKVLVRIEEVSHIVCEPYEPKTEA